MLLANAVAPNTRRAYRADWTHFTDWCAGVNQLSLPAVPTTVAYYLTAMVTEGYAPATLARRVCAISQAHQYAGYPSPTHTPTVATLLAGIRRTYGVAPRRQAAPLLLEEIQQICCHFSPTLLDIRDKAICLLAFAAALRESELVALEYEDIAFCPEGMTVRVRHSKTDPTGEGSVIAVALGKVPTTCPVTAVQAWLTTSGINEGKLFRGLTRHGTFRSDHLNVGAIDPIIRRAAARAGLDASRYSGHSFRCGHITTAIRHGVPERVVMQTSRHRSVEVFRSYVREASLWRECSSASLGL